MHAIAAILGRKEDPQASAGPFLTRDAYVKVTLISIRVPNALADFLRSARCKEDDTSACTSPSMAAAKEKNSK